MLSPIDSEGNIKVVPFLPRVIKDALGKNFVELFFSLCDISTAIPDKWVESILNPTTMPELLDLQLYANRSLQKNLAFDVNFSLSRDFPRPFENRKSLLSESELIILSDRFDAENKALISEVATWCPINMFSIIK